MKSRLVFFLSIVLLLVVTATACGGTAVSVSTLRQDYACSYALTVQEDTTTKDVASATRPEDLEANWDQTYLDVVSSWQQAVEERNSLLGEVKKGTTLQIPAKCSSTSGSSVPAPQR